MNPDSEAGRELRVHELVADAESLQGDDADRATYIARQLLIRSGQLQTPQERRQQAELDRFDERRARSGFWMLVGGLLGLLVLLAGGGEFIRRVFLSFEG